MHVYIYLLQNNKGKGRLKYLLQQTEIFAHFAKSDQAAQKKAKGKYVYGHCFIFIKITLLYISEFSVSTRS